MMTFWSGLSFYDFLVEECKLNQKVALMGVSRGGLFVYNWAKKNPDKVACIYAEAPVCDFKSWPSEFGKSEGSPADWERLKEEYGFISDDDAKQFADNPMDGLEVLAENKVPILHMIGLNDKIVPPDENTIPLINKFISIGGIATVVPCTKIGQKLKDHHFISKPSRLVADFIKYNTR
ncbi:MAG: sialidase-1 [Saprospiraceae bacterium]